MTVAWVPKAASFYKAQRSDEGWVILVSQPEVLGRVEVNIPSSVNEGQPDQDTWQLFSTAQTNVDGTACAVWMRKSGRTVEFWPVAT